jgi:hypothetical protein
MDRYIDSDFARKQIAKFIEQHKTPFMVTINSVSHRTVEQNKLQFLWMNEIAAQTGYTPDEVRAKCKLTIGIPILRAENERFRKAYDALLKPFDYEQKIRVIRELDLPVTRAMTKEQFSTYLERIYEQHTAEGYELTQPEIAEWR